MVVQRDAEPFKPPVSRSKVSPKAPVRSRRGPDLGHFLSDFRTGLGKLKELTQRMARDPAKPLQPNAASAARTEHRDIMLTLERELKLIEKTAPPEIRDRVVTAFRSKAESAIQMGVPQAYAQLVEASKLVPATAIRPNQSPAVRALLTTVKAIKSGRLAFLPRRTRVAARNLLRRVFASPRALYPPTTSKGAAAAPQTATAAAIAQQRMLPLVVQGMMRGYENAEQSKTYIDVINAARRQPLVSGSRNMPAAAPVLTGGSMPAAAPVLTGGSMPARPKLRPLPPQASAALAKAIPNFESEGISGAYAGVDPSARSHAFSYEPGEESLHTITKNDGLMTDADTPPAPAGAGSRPTNGAPSGAEGRPTRSAAPTSTSANTAPASAAAEPASGSSGPTTVTGNLSIDGLPDFIARVEMRLQGLEAVARKQ